MVIATKLSNIEKDNCDDASSIIFSVHTKLSTRAKNNKSFNVGQLDDIPSTSTTRMTTTSSINEEQQKIDRILFNLYASMASVLRCIESSSTPENNTDSQLNSNIIAAMTECIEQFFKAQPQCFTYGIFKFVEDRARGVPNFTDMGVLNSSDRATIISMNAGQQDDPMNGMGSSDQNREYNREPNTFPNDNRTFANPENASRRNSTDSLDQLSYYSLKRRFGDDMQPNHTEDIRQTSVTRDLSNLAIYNRPLSNRSVSSTIMLSEAYEVIDIDTYEQTGYIPPPQSHYRFPLPFKVESFSPIPPDMRQYPRYFNESSSRSNTEFRFTQNAQDENPNQNNSFDCDNVDMFDAGFQAATSAAEADDIFEFPTQLNSVFNVPLHSPRSEIESSPPPVLDFQFGQRNDRMEQDAEAQDLMQIGEQSQWIDTFQFDNFENQNVPTQHHYDLGMIEHKREPRKSESQISGRLSLAAINNLKKDSFDTNSGFFSNFSEYTTLHLLFVGKLGIHNF